MVLPMAILTLSSEEYLTYIRVSRRKMGSSSGHWLEKSFATESIMI
jgi:hypothetical protein